MADNFFVTAVLVTHDGSTWLPQVIAALESQKRKIDRIVAVDTGSRDNSVKLLKSAGIPTFLEDRDMGYGDAIDHALELTPPAKGVEGNEWIWLIHDDCAPDKHALAHLLQAIEDRPQVAIAGPKLRGWYDRDHLLEIGVSIASNGARWTGLERGEQDQGQHDGVREVLAVSTAGALIRRDVYEELGGLDTNLALFRDDVDLGWRAYVAGHAVIAVPDAIAYHAEASATERRTVDVSEAFLHRPLLLDRRNAAYVLLVNSSFWTLPWISIQLLSTSFARAVMNLLAKLPGYAGDEIAAVGLLLIHPAEIFQARKYRKKKRLISPRIIRRFIPPKWSQFRMASERIATFIAESVRPKELSENISAPASYSDLGEIDENFDYQDSLPAKDAPLWKLLARKPQFILFFTMSVVSLLAARSRLGSLSGGALAIAPNSGLSLIAQYAQSWHLVGMGSAALTPPWVPLIGLASIVTGFNLPLFLTVLFLVAPIVAFYIFYQLLTKLGLSRIYALVGAGIYSFSPVVWASINQGRLGTLVIILIAPSLYFIAPFTRDNEKASWRRIFAISLLIAVLCSFNPIILVGWFLLQGYRLCVTIFELRHLYREVGFQKIIFLPQSGAVKRRFALFITPWLLTSPWCLALLLHPTQFFLEPGIPLSAGSRWDILLANPGGAGSPPLWLISPVLLFALAAFAIPELRTASLMATTVIAAAVALSAFTIQGHGSSANIWTGPLIAIATALLIPGVLIFAQGFIPQLRKIPLGRRHIVVAVISLVTALSLIGTPIWAITGGSQSPVKANQSQIVPAFVSALADSQAKPKTIVINVIDGQTMYEISRGSDISLGDADVTIAPPQEITSTMNDLISGAGIESAKILGRFGIQYVFLKAVNDASLIRTIDGSGGFSRMSATPAGIMWKVVGASPRVLFIGIDHSVQVISSRDFGADGDVKIAGSVILAEKYDQNWRLLLDGVRVALEHSSNGLPVFTVSHPGHITLIHDGTLHRALISLQLIVLLATVVLALPAGRRRREMSLEELV